MSKPNKTFIIPLLITAALLIGVMSENIISTLKPKYTRPPVDVAKIKEQIQKAGLVPYEAKYWEQIK